MALARASLACIVLSVLCQASRTTDEQRAQAWLAAHGNPDDAGMNELKASDPNAFAIVQALLTKRNLGLLDPRHPSASFTASAPSEHRSFAEAAAAAGITADTPAHAAADTGVQKPYPDVADANPYPEVEQYKSHDPWSFKASHDDDDLVQNVLGQATALQAGGAAPNGDGTSSAHDESVNLPSNVHALGSSFEKRMPAQPSLDWGNRFAGTSSRSVPQVAPPVIEKPRAAMDQANSYVYSPAARHDSYAYSPPPPRHDSYVYQAPPRREVAVIERRRSPVSEANPYLPPPPFKVSPISQAPSYTYTRPSRRADVVAVEKPQPAMSQENSYLTGIDFSAELEQAHAHNIKTEVYPQTVQARASMNQENSYLKGIDFSAELAAAQKHQALRAIPAPQPVTRLAPVPQQALDGSARLAPVPQQALAGSVDGPVDAPDGSFLKGFDFSNEMQEVGINQAASAPAKPQTNGYLNGIDFHSATTEVAAPAPVQEAPVPPQPRPQVQPRTNQYLDVQAAQATLNVRAAQASATNAAAEKDLEESDFHRLAAQYRQEETPPAAPQQRLDLGSTFDKDLAAAKSNNWKRALAGTDWGSDKPRMSMARVSSKTDDKDDDDFDLETPRMITNHISSWLDHTR